MIEEEGQARLFLFSMSEVVKTSNTNQMPRKCEQCTNAEFRGDSKLDLRRIRFRIIKIIFGTKLTKIKQLFKPQFISEEVFFLGSSA